MTTAGKPEKIYRVQWPAETSDHDPDHESDDESKDDEKSDNKSNDEQNVGFTNSSL
jgi:hypothetical protein